METKWKSTTAGILVMIAGIVGIISGVANIGLGAIMGLNTFWSYGIPALGGFGMMSIGLGITWVVIGVIVLLGGVRARKRKSWGFALTAAILAVPLVIPLGALAIIFISLAKGEFK